jgi:hypothetical protein
MVMIGRNAAIAEVGEHHELEGVAAYSMWLGVHIALLSGLRVKVHAFVDWVWNYFSQGGGPMLRDRSDATRISGMTMTEIHKVWMKSPCHQKIWLLPTLVRPIRRARRNASKLERTWVRSGIVSAGN